MHANEIFFAFASYCRCCHFNNKASYRRIYEYIVRHWVYARASMFIGNEQSPCRGLGSCAKKFARVQYTQPLNIARYMVLVAFHMGKLRTFGYGYRRNYVSRQSSVGKSLKIIAQSIDYFK